MWNDDQSTDTIKSNSSSKAHSKGILAYGSNSGFHLLHSLPCHIILEYFYKILSTYNETD